MNYHDFIRQEAALIHADGCTGITNIDGWPCLEHDVQFYYGRSAGDAFRLARQGVRDYWSRAARITFEEANAHFKAANFRESTLGYFNPMAWWRWRGMKLKATRTAWDKHRAREQAALGVGA